MATGSPPTRTAPRGTIRQRLAPRVLPAFTVIAILYLMIPIVVMIVFSFNKSVGKFNYTWNEFSLTGWLHPFDWPGLGDAVAISLAVALISILSSLLSIRKVMVLEPAIVFQG